MFDFQEREFSVDEAPSQVGSWREAQDVKKTLASDDRFSFTHLHMNDDDLQSDIDCLSEISGNATFREEESRTAAGKQNIENNERYDLKPFWSQPGNDCQERVHGGRS